MTKFRSRPIVFRTQLILFFIILIQNFSTACSCYPYEPVFCRIVGPGLNVVSVVVLDQPTIDSSTMRVKVLENLNKTIVEDTITIIGQDGLNCGESLYLFNLQDTLILGLLELANQSKWYLEGFCGLHYLRLENGMVKGQITDTDTIKTYQLFKDDLTFCLALRVNTEDHLRLVNQLKVFPNPASALVNVHSDQSILSYELYHTSGQLLDTRHYKELNDAIEINTGHLEFGIYYLRIRTSKGILTRKFMVD